MPRFFDIIPPQPKKTKEKLKKNYKVLWSLILIFLVIFIFGLFIKACLVTQKQITKSQSSIVVKSNDLNQDNKNTFKVRLLDGSGKPGEIDIIKQILTGSGSVIEQAGSYSNISNKTVVYYKNGRADDAKTIADSLKNNLQLNEVTNEESDTLGQTYDFLIVLGKSSL